MIGDPIQNRRSPGFPGTDLRLADGKRWIFPGPLWDVLPKDSATESEYLGLLEMCLESQDKAERQQSFLALAIFLLGLNYDLSPDDYSALLGFRSDSSELRVWQAEFGRIAETHLEEFIKRTGPQLAPPRTPALRGWRSRILAPFRAYLPFEKWFLNSGEHGA